MKIEAAVLAPTTFGELDYGEVGRDGDGDLLMRLQDDGEIPSEVDAVNLENGQIHKVGTSYPITRVNARVVV